MFRVPPGRRPRRQHNGRPSGPGAAAARRRLQSKSFIGNNPEFPLKDRSCPGHNRRGARIDGRAALNRPAGGRCEDKQRHQADLAGQPVQDEETGTLVVSSGALIRG